MNTSARAFFYVIVGAPGAGKSSQIQVMLNEHAPRRLIFDIEGEYSKAGTVMRTREAVARALLAAGPRGPFSIVYQPGTDDAEKLRARFDSFCMLAFAARNVLVVVDELADVDSPNPYEVCPGWKVLLKRGRKRDVRVVAGTVRPAEVSKLLWTFATRLRVGRLAYSNDERELAAALKVDRAEVAALVDTQWIERDRLAGTLTYGRIEWRQGRPRNVPRPASSAMASRSTAAPGGAAAPSATAMKARAPAKIISLRPRRPNGRGSMGG